MQALVELHTTVPDLSRSTSSPLPCSSSLKGATQLVKGPMLNAALPLARPWMVRRPVLWSTSVYASLADAWLSSLPGSLEAMMTLALALQDSGAPAGWGGVGWG
jgi:hypothetical protein